MVQDNLHDPTSLTPTGIACIWRALEAPSALPINYVCRLLAQAGLSSRLFSVVRQAISLQARSDRAQQQQQQQQQPGGPRHGHAPSGSLLLAKGWESGGEEGGGSGPRSPLSSKEVAAGAGGLAGARGGVWRSAFPGGWGSALHSIKAVCRPMRAMGICS